MSMEPEQIRQRVNDWIAARPTPPNPDDFVAVLPDEILGPFPTDSEASQTAFERGSDKQAAIVQLAEVNQAHQQGVLGARLIDRGTARS